MPLSYYPRDRFGNCWQTYTAWLVGVSHSLLCLHKYIKDGNTYLWMWYSLSLKHILRQNVISAHWQKHKKECMFTLPEYIIYYEHMKIRLNSTSKP